MRILTSPHSLFALILLAVTTTLLVLGKISSDQWVSVAQWVYVAFVSGHAVMTSVPQLMAGSAKTPS